MKTIKNVMLSLMKKYHQFMVNYYDRKSHKKETMGYSGMWYSEKAWYHVYKEIEIHNKLIETKGI